METQQAVQPGIQYPADGERISGRRYDVKIRAPRESSAVEIAVDGHEWRGATWREDAWVFEWSDFSGGGHTLFGRVRGPQGDVALEPRRVVVYDGTSAREADPQVQAAVAKLGEHGALFGELWFTELSGKPWRYDIAEHQVDEDCFERGVTLDGPVTGKPWKGLITTTPDPNSVFIDPVSNAPTVALFCDVDDAGNPGMDPRQVLKRGQAYLKSTGVADAFVIGAESEFFLLDGPSGPPAPEEVVWDFVRSLALALTRTGFNVDGFRYGPNPGQGRVQMRNADAMRIADQTLFYRYIARTIARRHGLCVKFAPKPLPGDGFSNFPTHHALWKEGRNVFHSDSGWALTSDECRWYAGGLLAHAPALLALVAPTVGSYRRLESPGASTGLFLSRTAEKAACRIPARSTSAAARRLKFKLADTSSNPYLAFAAMLMAGLDGIENKLEPPVEAETKNDARLPRSLSEALDALRADRGFLTKGGVFTDVLLEAWTADRRENELG